MPSKELRPPLPEVVSERNSRCPAPRGASGWPCPFGQEDRHSDRHGKAHYGLAGSQRAGSRHPPPWWLGHQSLQTTGKYLRAGPAETLGALSERRLPGFGKGRFTGVKDELTAMLASV